MLFLILFILNTSFALSFNYGQLYLEHIQNPSAVVQGNDVVAGVEEEAAECRVVGVAGRHRPEIGPGPKVRNVTVERG